MMMHRTPSSIDDGTPSLFPLRDVKQNKILKYLNDRYLPLSPLMMGYKLYLFLKI